MKIENVELEVIGKEAFQENSQLSIINSQLEKVDIVVFLVTHKEFSIIYSQFSTNKKVLDFCGIY
jgi:UDP-N-acetyl-D-mannosaminuronate dehydrogenase